MRREQRDQLIERLLTFMKKRDLLTDAPMSRYTTLRLGGPAELLCEISSAEQLRQALCAAVEYEVPVTILGNGSNLLVKDGGLPGMTLHLGDGFSQISDPVPLPDGRVALTAQAGAPLVRLSNAAADAGLTGLEFAAGIPGTVGGGVCMNAGAYGGELKDVIDSVTVAAFSGETRRYANAQMEFGYRTSLIQTAGEPLIILSATVALSKGDEETIRATMREFNAKRREKQPLTVPCCGSTFKRPAGHFAGTLIEECGMKGYRIGGAAVSEKHAGFVVNDGGGTAAEYMAVIAAVQRAVWEKKGVRLEPEVRVVGVDAPAVEL